MPGFLRDEVKRVLRRAIWSLRGWRAAWQSEKSLRQWVLANLVSAGLAMALPIGTGARAAIIGLGIMVLAAELLNTAIEEAVDIATQGHDPRAARAKDCASAGVALAAIATGAAWAVGLWGIWAG